MRSTECHPAAVRGQRDCLYSWPAFMNDQGFLSQLETPETNRTVTFSGYDGPLVCRERKVGDPSSPRPESHAFASLVHPGNDKMLKPHPKASRTWTLKQSSSYWDAAKLVKSMFCALMKQIYEVQSSTIPRASSPSNCWWMSTARSGMCCGDPNP